jgi:hypothetical protein
MATNAFIAKVEHALEELVTLNIVTAVGEAQIESSGTPSRKITMSGKSKVIWTSIDLLQGDITTVIHPELQGDAGKDLREFHKGRELQGIAIIKENIAALRDIMKLLQEAYESRDQRPKDLPAAKTDG